MTANVIEAGSHFSETNYCIFGPKWVFYISCHFIFSTIPLDLIPERKPKKKIESSIDEIHCSEACNNDCDCEEEPETPKSKVSSTNVSPPSVRVEGCTPPSDDEHLLATELLGKAYPEECEYIH